MQRWIELTGSTALAVAFAVWLIPTGAHAQAKCCECGTVASDQASNVVCFNDAANNGAGATGCPAFCAACSLLVTKFNANEACTAQASCNSPVDIFDNPSDGCGAVEPPDCETDDDCTDPGVCLTAVCETGTCQIQADDTESCTDGDVCTENDRCEGGTCVADPIQNCISPTAPAPAASNWGLIALASSLFILAVVVLRRRGART